VEKKRAVSSFYVIPPFQEFCMGCIGVYRTKKSKLRSSIITV